MYQNDSIYSTPSNTTNYLVAKICTLFVEYGLTRADVNKVLERVTRDLDNTVVCCYGGYDLNAAKMKADIAFQHRAEKLENYKEHAQKVAREHLDYSDFKSEINNS